MFHGRGHACGKKMIERLVLGARGRCGGGIVLGALGVFAVSASGMAAPEASGTERGFVVTSFYYANNDGGPEACPEGLTVSSRDMYLAGLPPAERAEMSKVDKELSLYAISIRGKDGK